MPRTLLTPVTISRTGAEAQYILADNEEGIRFVNTEREFLHVKNEGIDPISITIPTPMTVDGLSVGDRLIPLAAGAERFIGPFPNSIYQQSADQSVYVNIDGAPPTIALIKFP